MTTTDYAHACRTCGYDERVGRHGIIGRGADASHFVLQCLVPQSARPLAFHVLDRRALPPDGPDIGPDVPGGGAV